MDRYGISIGKTPPPPKKSREPKEPEKPKGRLSDSEKEALIARLMQTPGGRARIATSFANPLRQRMDYSSIARRASHVDPLPQGAMPLYDINADQESYSIDQTGQQIISTPRMHGNRIEIPLFEIAANPQISLTAVRERRFELLDRVQEEAVRTLREQEELNAFSLLERITSNNFVQGESELTINNLLEIFNSIERNDLRVSCVFMNAREYTNLRRSDGFRGSFDAVTRRELLQSGLFGTLFGAQVIVSRRVPEGLVFATADPQYVGVMPIQTNITSLPADDPVNRRIGFSIFETIGMACYNPRGVAVLSTRPESVIESPPIMEQPRIAIQRMDRYALMRALGNV